MHFPNQVNIYKFSNLESRKALKIPTSKIKQQNNKFKKLEIN
jgi:hypothetical protein